MCSDPTNTREKTGIFFPRLNDLGDFENLNSASDSYYSANTWGMGSWPGGNWGAGTGVAPHRSTGNWDRGAIVIWNAGHINIENIEIKNVHNSRGDAAGIRILADNGPINITGMKVTYSDNGVDICVGTGDGTEVVTLSRCEFGYNGRYPNHR